MAEQRRKGIIIMKNLTKSDKYAIEFLHKQNKTEKEISEELGCSLAQVKKTIKSFVVEEPQKAPEIQKDNTKNLMIRQTSAKKVNSVSIMTEGAAQLSDEFIKTLPTNPKNTDSFIYRRSE
jgi:IS30 family transposase